MSKINDTAKDIWLLLLAKGGWWAPREVDIELDLVPGTASMRMQRLKKYDALSYRVRESHPRVRGEYAVMGTCSIPQGITITEVGDALTPGPAAQARSDLGLTLSPAERTFARASGDFVEAGLVCQACAGDAPRGQCRNPKCIGRPIVRELVPHGVLGTSVDQTKGPK